MSEDVVQGIFTYFKLGLKGWRMMTAPQLRWRVYRGSLDEYKIRRNWDCREQKSGRVLWRETAAFSLDSHLYNRT